MRDCRARRKPTDRPSGASRRLLDPAAVDDIALLGDQYEAGGAFVLDEKSRSHATADAGEGWIVEIRSGSRVVVARSAESLPTEETHALAVNAAQRGLDLFSLRGLGDLHIRQAEDENLTWWKDEGQRIIRIFAVAPLSMDVPPVTVRITDASGKERPASPEPETAWHPSFRYFRLAQVSEEVFDAYRNLYLALESILSTRTPLKPGERDNDWIGRALTEAAADGLNLAAFAPKGAVDPVDSIRSDLYSDTRTATFHAKTGKPALLPVDSVDRSVVLASLSRLAHLWLALVEHTLGVRRSGGGIFRAGFDLMIGNIVDELQICVTDDPVRAEKTDIVANPGGGLVKHLASRPTPELDRPFLRTLVGEASVEDLTELTHVARVVTVTSDGTLFTAGQLEGELTLGGFDLLRVAMGIRGLNVRQPRSFYPM